MLYYLLQAYYCIKMTGIFEGKLGTKRFCSSRNWGNYCEYISRPGDIQEYRSWLPDGYSRIFRIVCVWPFGLLDYGSATLRCKI